MNIKILYGGFLTTLQDLGRSGYGRFGVPVSGPMDRFAFCAANQLVGNPWNTTALEIGIDGPQLTFDEDCLVALTGLGYSLMVQDREQPIWTSVLVRQGQTIQINRQGNGNWAVLAVSGGVQVKPVLGSTATYLRGGLGGVDGKPLQSGDTLKVDAQSAARQGQVGKMVPTAIRPAYTLNPTLEVILGPQEDRFSEDGIRTFLSNAYNLSSTSDRMGYRLEGAKIEHVRGADILSDGMLFGSVQVPASGQPIIMMSESGTTGGYTKIATVIGADLPLLAQAMPGSSQVRFKTTTVEAAQIRYRALYQGLVNGCQVPQEDEEETFGYI